MKKASAVALVLMTLGAAALAQTPASQWITYQSPDGQFSARFPSAPRASTQESKNRDGQPMTQHLLSAQEGDSVFQIGYFAIPPDQVFTFPEARDGMVRNVNGTLLSETPITVSGYPGMDLVVTADAQGYSYVINTRVVHTPRRAYFIQTVQLRTAPYQAEKTAQFLSSLRIMP